MLINFRLYPEVSSEELHDFAYCGSIERTEYVLHNNEKGNSRSILDYGLSYRDNYIRNHINNMINHRGYSNALRRRRRSHRNGNAITDRIT